LALGVITGWFTKDEAVIKTHGVSVRCIISDYACWTINIKNETNSLKDIQEKRQADKQAVRDILASWGLKDCIVDESFKVEDQHRYAYNSDTMRFDLTDSITVKSKDVAKVQKAIISFTESLMSQGIRVNNNVRYFYSDLSQLKLELIEEATIDAKNRAVHVAQTMGYKVKKLGSIDTGIFSITSAATSDSLKNDYSEGEGAVNKKVRVVVHGTFKARSN
jgi:hypothetical protein